MITRKKRMRKIKACQKDILRVYIKANNACKNKMKRTKTKMKSRD